jgi:hypothetical protein
MEFGASIFFTDYSMPIGLTPIPPTGRVRSWLRQAGVLLICVVMVANYGEAKFVDSSGCARRCAGEQGSNIDVTTHFCGSQFLEGIAVSNNDNKVISFPIVEPTVCNLGACENIITRPQRKWPLIFFSDFGRLDCKIGWKRPWHNPNLADAANVVGWSLASVERPISDSKHPGGSAFLQLQTHLIGRSEYISAQLPFRRLTGITDLNYDNDHKQQRYRAKAEGGQSYGVIDRLIDKPREAGLISMFIGVGIGAIGIALYLNRGWKIGMGLLCVGMFTPLFPWWLAILIWWAGN